MFGRFTKWVLKCQMQQKCFRFKRDKQTSFKRYEYQVRFQIVTMTTSKLRLTVASLEDHASPGNFNINL